MARSPRFDRAARRSCSLVGCALAVLLTACAAPGRDDATYYYANREPAKPVPAVQPQPMTVPVPADLGPLGVAHIVYFDFDRATVRKADEAILAAHARFLRQHPERKLTLEGHTDPRGGRVYNLALGQRRAEAVQKSLALLGANESNIEAVSWGMERASPQGSEAGFQLDRRTEFSYR